MTPLGLSHSYRKEKKATAGSGSLDLARESNHALGTVIYVIDPKETNATFAANLCSNVSGTTTGLTILASSSPGWFTLPSCLRNTLLTTFSSQGTRTVQISSFAVFPPTLTTLTALSAHLGPSATPYVEDPTDGFDANGNMVWAEIWSALPQITTFQLANSNAKGGLPTWLPANLTTLDLTATSISGNIPASMFVNTSTAASFTFMAPHCKLNGPIPNGLFNSWSTASDLQTLYVDLSFNALSSSIPNNLFTPFGGLQLWSFTFILNNNQLTGSLPSLSPANMMSSSAANSPSYTVSLFFNGLTGTIPPTPFGAMPNLTYFGAHSNFLSGSLPSQLFSSWSMPSAGYYSLMLNNNTLNGSVPSTLLTGGLTTNAIITSFFVFLQQNQLTGSIPSDLLYQVDSTRRRDYKALTLTPSEIGANDRARESASVATPSIIIIRLSSITSFEFSDNRLVGPLPLLFTHSFVANALSVGVSFRNNPINGTIPGDFFSGIPDTSRSTGLTLQLRNASLTGTLPAALCTANTYLVLQFPDNALTGPIPGAWSVCNIRTLNIANNPNLAGSIPPSFLNNSLLTSLAAADTSLSGEMPPIGSQLSLLSLESTKIVFCESSSAIASFASLWGGSVCILSNSSACDCKTDYSVCAIDNCPAPVAPSPPTVPPTPTPATCSEKSRPSIDFFCMAGVWTANSTKATTLTIPSGAGTVVVTGNVASTSIVLQGVGTSIEISGCASNLTTILVEVDPSEAETAGKTLQTLISTNSANSNCSDDLSGVNIITKSTSSKCKKISTQKVVLDGGSTLGAYFSVDSSGCKTWWIILISVICSLIVIAVIVLVLLAIFYKPFRNKIRPYSKSRPAVRQL